MKKLLALVLAAACLLSLLSGCAAKPEEPEIVPVDDKYRNY